MAVYFIRQGVTGPVKIGVANDVVKRLRQLQTNQSVALRIIRIVKGGRDEESALHQRFAARRLTGEWFTFSDEMTSENFGYEDLPIPLIKRNSGRNFPDNAWGRERCLHQEILAIIGGAEVLARRMRLPTWIVAPNTISPQYWSAASLLLNDAGRHDITLKTINEARAATNAQFADVDRHNQAIEDEEKRLTLLQIEADWVRENGSAAAWWTLSEPEEEDRPAVNKGPAA